MAALVRNVRLLMFLYLLHELVFCFLFSKHRSSEALREGYSPFADRDKEAQHAPAKVAPLHIDSE
jgi:hypothetical protein